MTQIKLCGLSRPEDIDAVITLRPDFIGFVMWDKSKRNVTEERAAELKKRLDDGLQAALSDGNIGAKRIRAVGVFVDEDPQKVAGLLNRGIIDIAQLHGSEDEEYVSRLRTLAPGKQIIQAFQIKSKEDVERALKSDADYLLLDSGTGSGQSFNWELIRKAAFKQPFFLAGGLDAENVSDAIKELHPFAVDVSSGIETDGVKDSAKMKKFVNAVRDTDKYTTV